MQLDSDSKIAKKDTGHRYKSISFRYVYLENGVEGKLGTVVVKYGFEFI